MWNLYSKQQGEFSLPHDAEGLEAIEIAQDLPAPLRLLSSPSACCKTAALLTVNSSEHCRRMLARQAKPWPGTGPLSPPYGSKEVQGSGGRGLSAGPRSLSYLQNMLALGLKEEPEKQSNVGDYSWFLAYWHTSEPSLVSGTHMGAYCPRLRLDQWSSRVPKAFYES